MVNIMTVQKYLLIDVVANVCDNLILWDGDTNTWQPPENHIALLEATTPAYVWEKDGSGNWVLTEHVGYGGIGFTWDGTALTTNQPQPS